MRPIANSRTAPPTWLIGISALTFGLVAGFVITALPFLLSKAGISLYRIATVSAVAMSPTFWACRDRDCRPAARRGMKRELMKTTTTGVILLLLHICCLAIAARDSQKVLFENSIIRVGELSNHNERAHHDCCPSLLITLDSIKPAKWTFNWETSDSARTLPPMPTTLRIELKRSPSRKDIPLWPASLDAVSAAPNSHRALFENAMIRVLEVSVPPTKEPFHVHRWPSIFIYLDSGGPSGAQRYYNKDGKITHDHPRTEKRPINPPEWRVKWMEPEPLHAIENMETVESSRTLPYRPATIRIEFKAADSLGPAK